MFKNKTRTNNLLRSTTGTTLIVRALNMLHILFQNLISPARSIVPLQTLPTTWFVCDFILAEEGLAKMRIVSIASSTLPDANPGRLKKTEARRDKFKKLVENYHIVSLKDWWMAVIAIYAKWV